MSSLARLGIYFRKHSKSIRPPTPAFHLRVIFPILTPPIPKPFLVRLVIAVVLGYVLVMLFLEVEISVARSPAMSGF